MADANDSIQSDFETSLMEVQALSDEELFDKLKSQGRDIGPVVETTRRLYQKQLATILSSPQQRGTTPVANGTNGTTDGGDQNGDDGSDTDESVGNLSRASHGSRSGSVPRRSVGRRSVTKTPQKSTPEVFADAEEVSSKPKTKFSTSTYTPPKSPRTFEEYVAESEARAKGQSYNSHSAATGDVDTAPGSGNMKLLLVLAVLALIGAYFFLVYKNVKPDQDTVIEEEIDALRQRFMEEEPVTEIPQ